MLYLFDGHNILHAGDFADERELVDVLAGFVALQGARGVVVFDGHGDPRSFGPLGSATPRMRTTSSSGWPLRTGTASRSGSFPRTARSADRRAGGQPRVGPELPEVDSAEPPKATGGPARTQIGDALDKETQEKLEAWRRRRH